MNKSISCKRKFREQNKASGSGCLGRKQGTLYFPSPGMLGFGGYPDSIIQIKFRKFHFNFPQLFVPEWLWCAWCCARDRADGRDEPACLSRTTENKTCTWVRAIQITRCPWETLNISVCVLTAPCQHVSTRFGVFCVFLLGATKSPLGWCQFCSIGTKAWSQPHVWQWSAYPGLISLQGPPYSTSHLPPSVSLLLQDPGLWGFWKLEDEDREFCLVRTIVKR